MCLFLFLDDASVVLFAYDSSYLLKGKQGGAVASIFGTICV